MRKQIFFISSLFGLVFSAFGQNKSLLYDFNEIPQSVMINPGVQSDFKWYAGVPALSHISFQIGSSGVNANALFADDGISFNDKVRDRLIFGMTPRDELSGNYQIELLNFGFRGRDTDNLYTAGIYHEGDAIGYWFRDYAILAFEGNAGRVGQRFDLGHLKTRGDILNVFHFGVNHQWKRNMTIGARAKIYSSILSFDSSKNKGYFETIEGQNNLLSSTLVADLRWRTSGINDLKAAEEDGTIASTVLKKGLLGGNLGLGFDLGFTYNLNEQTVLTGSLLDLGFIYHTKDVMSYSLKGSATVEGVQIILPDALTDPDADFWQELVDEIEQFVPFEDNTKNYLTFRPTKLYASIRHDFGEQIPTRANCDCGPYAALGSFRQKYANSVGGQLYMVNRPRGPQAALSAFYMRRLGNVLALKTTYTIDKFSATNIGLGLNLQAGPVNLYFMADNLLGYRNIANSNYASFQLGLNIISWGKN